jgi:energy-coupling factor transporter ATP-binding protein EcfA2
MGNQYDECERKLLPNGKCAVVAKYISHGLPEYDSNPLIQALPPILDDAEFIEEVQHYPLCTSDDRNLPAKLRYHCVERLTAPVPQGYFQPLNRHIELHRLVIITIMQGYIARNIKQPEHAIRAGQIHKALIQRGGSYLEEFLNVESSASSITLIGPSGCGKSTALLRILNLLPQVIYHPEEIFFQITYIKVDCPHSGSLKDLCKYIFIAVDKILGTNEYYKKFGSTERNSEGVMLAQVATIMNNHGIGAIVIDELQHLTGAKKELPERMLNYFVTMVNSVGVVVIRAGTNKAVDLLNKGLRHARRAGGIFWNLMSKDEDWELFIGGVLEAQWTKSYIPLFTSDGEPNELFYKFSDALFYESQGIPDIAIKIHKMAQWRAIALGRDEVITPDLIHQVAEEGLVLVKPILDAIRSKDPGWMDKYDDISSVDTEEYYQKWLSKLESLKLAEIRKQARQQQKQAENASAALRHIILELLKLEVEPPALAKICAEKVLASSTDYTDIPSLVKKAYILALEGLPNKESKTVSKPTHLEPNSEQDDLRLIVENAQKTGISEFEALKAEGVFDIVQRLV